MSSHAQVQTRTLNGPNFTTRLANEERVLSPRFYTTKIEELERIDLAPVAEAVDGDDERT